jgi:hypothetical protein
MKKKQSKPSKKPKRESGKSPVEKGSEQNSEVQEQVRLGIGLMAEYRQTLAELAKC